MRNRLVPWPLFRGHIKVTSTIALHSTLNISETVKDRGLVPKDNQQWPTVNQMVSWPMASREPERSNSLPIRLKSNISKTAGDKTPFQRTTNRKWPLGYQMVTWPMTPHDSERCCVSVRSAMLAIVAQRGQLFLYQMSSPKSKCCSYFDVFLYLAVFS